MYRFHLPSLVPLALALALAACDRSSQEPVTVDFGSDTSNLGPEKLAAYDAETARLKARLSDPADIDGALRDLNSRFGIANPAPEAEATPGPVQPTSALAKAASVSLWVHVKSLDVTYPYATVRDIQVPNGSTVTASTNRIDAALDPYMVAFYNPTKPFVHAYDAYTDHDPVTLAGVDDDGAGNLNSKIVWTNNTGDTRMVTFVTLAFSSARVGRGQTKYTVSGGSLILGGTIKAVRIFSNTGSAPAGCAGASNSRISLKLLGTHRYGTGFLAANPSTKKGANIWENDNTVNLGFYLPANGVNFVVPYLQDLDGDTYPDPNHYSATQDDLYSCAF